MKKRPSSASGGDNDRDNTKYAKDDENTKYARDEDNTKYARDEDNTKYARDEDNTKYARDEDNTKYARDEDNTKYARDDDNTKYAGDQAMRGTASLLRRRAVDAAVEEALMSAAAAVDRVNPGISSETRALLVNTLIERFGSELLEAHIGVTGSAHD